jgi:SAM-dependent methyltransferase
VNVGALAPYEEALRAVTPLRLITRAGQMLDLDVSRWLAKADTADRTVLDRCRGPVLDVGCGPGRMIAALTARGIPALGVDIAGAAVDLTRGQGQPALLRDVFGSVPGEGRWPTVLLVDGNIGIGGEPRRLLTRIAGLLAPIGRAIVETSPLDRQDALLRVRFADEDGRAIGPEFSWAQVGCIALDGYARAAGLTVVDTWQAQGRSFVQLVRR